MNHGRSSREEERARGDRVEQDVKSHISALNSFKEYSGDLLVKDAESLAESIRDLKTAQLRRIYGEVKRIEMDVQKDKFSRERIVLLKPRLAYAARKDEYKKDDLTRIKNVFSLCIDRIKDQDDFSRFVSFFEAILAYHR